MDQTILRRDVVRQIYTGAPFDMEFVTCNRSKGTGGDLIRVESWLIVSVETQKVPGTEKKVPGDEPQVLGKGLSRDPHHDQHGTINIYNPENAGVHPHKVHIDLIQFFNGKRVVN